MAPGDTNAGRTPRVVAAAYTNPDNDPAQTTTLFDIDSALAIGVTQNPPNDGTLNTFGPLGSAVTDQVGFDASLTDFFVAAQPTGATTSSLIQFTGGQRRDLGVIGAGEVVHSIAVSLGTPFAPLPERVYAVTAGGDLVSFDANNPGSILSRAPVANLNTGERVVGIDFRPANNRLYALGSSSQLYIIDARTGIASRVGAPLSAALSGTEFGVDFNPTVDRIRLVSDTGQTSDCIPTPARSRSWTARSPTRLATRMRGASRASRERRIRTQIPTSTRAHSCSSSIPDWTLARFRIRRTRVC